MEALNSIRFWRPNNDGHKENRAKPSCGNNSSSTEAPQGLIVSDHEFDEGDDSFFDLELAWMKGNMNGEKRFESKEEQTRSLSPNDNFSERKIIPIEATSKPQSPMTLLKSAPKFRVFTLRKSKSMANTSTITTYIADKPELTPKHERQGSNKHSRVTFQIQDSPITKGKKTEESLKDVMQKYFNKINPLYVKVSKNETKISGDLTMSMKEKQGNICKQLGKSRSASATSSPLNKRDDSLLQQHDGIQSAILHCKKSLNSPRGTILHCKKSLNSPRGTILHCKNSLNSPREPCRLSRCTSDSSQEKLSNASSTDSCLLSGVTSNSSYEKLMDSARISSEERNVSHHLMY